MLEILLLATEKGEVLIFPFEAIPNKHLQGLSNSIFQQ